MFRNILFCYNNRVKYFITFSNSCISHEVVEKVINLSNLYKYQTSYLFFFKTNYTVTVQRADSFQ